MKLGCCWPLALGCLLLLLGGCSSKPGLVALVVPEQRHLDIRAPADIPTKPLPQVPPPVTVSKSSVTGTSAEMSLNEAIRLALANSQVIRVLTGTTVVSSGKTIYDPAIANTAIDVARSTFDPVVEVKNTFNRVENPQAVFAPFTPAGAAVTGTRIDNYDLGLGISKKMVTGATVSVDGTLNAAQFFPGPAPLNPQQRSAITMSLTQPLLQGAGIHPNVAPIILARLQTEQSYFQFKDSMQELVRSVIEAYWGVVFARTDVWARQQQVKQATFALTRAEARKEAGFGTAGDVAQARVALYNFKANLITSEANLLQREAALRNILALPPTQPERIVPTTPPTPERLDPSWDEIVRLAEEMRPDLIELTLILEADDQQLVQARNQALPKVDATLFYRWNGLSGTAPSKATLATGPGQYTDWSLGVNFSVPLGLRQSRANLRNAELILIKDRANLEQGRLTAMNGLAASVRNLAQFYEQYQAFRETRSAARANLEQQAADFRAGRAIFLNVLQAITDWGNAVSSEAQALAQYNTELARLERETGTILESHGIWFSEERYGSIGPLGRLAKPCPYPLSLVPGPNSERYQDAGEPADKALEKEIPSLKNLPDVQPERPPALRPQVQAAPPATPPAWLGPPQAAGPLSAGSKAAHQ